MHSYKAFMPMWKGQKIVHLKAHGLNTQGVQFVSFEQTQTGSGSLFAERNRYFVTAPSLDSESIRRILAQINRCVEHEIELVDEFGRIIQRGSIEDSSRWENVGRPLPPLFEDHDHESEG